MPSTTGRIDEIRIGRFRERIFFDFDGCDTTLITPGLARKFASLLVRFAEDCEQVQYSQSKLPIENIKEGP